MAATHTKSRTPKASTTKRAGSKSTNRGLTKETAKGSNPRFPKTKGIGSLKGPSATKSSTRSALRKVAIKSGVKRNLHKGMKLVSRSVRPTRGTK